MMNRSARRAAERRAHALRKLAGKAFRLENGRKPTDRYLNIDLRPMTIADMVPGYSYEPGLSLVTISVPATLRQDGQLWQMPIALPPELREPTAENARTAFAILYGSDPEARAIIDNLKRLAPPWSEVVPTLDQQEIVGRLGVVSSSGGCS